MKRFGFLRLGNCIDEWERITMDIEKKRETNQVRNSENRVLFYYLLYSITFACLLILLWRSTKFSILDECLILLIPPILYFSFHFPRFYYVSASVIFYLTCIGTLYIIGGAFVTQSQTATIFILTILLTSEVIYRSRKRELVPRLINSLPLYGNITIPIV